MTRTIQTPKGPAQITSWQNTGAQPYYFRMWGEKAEMIPYIGKINLTVVLKSDSIFNEKLFFNVLDSVHSLTLERREKKGGDVVFEPRDTRQISQIYEGKLMVGVPADTCWLFKVVPGEINTYAPFPTNIDDFYTAVQKGDGPIVRMTKNNLKAMIGDNPKLIKMVDKGKLYQAVWKYNGQNN